MATPSSLSAIGSFFKGLASKSLEDYVVIILGIILVAAGLYAFKTTQTVINTVGNTVKKGAVAASA